jgi:nitrate reductase gamma subunit
MYDRSGGRFRWLPQEILDDIAEKADPLLNILVFAAPYLAPLALLGSVLFGLLWYRMEKIKGPHFTIQQEKAIRSIPLGVGLWGLIVMHLMFVAIPRVPQALGSHAYARDAMEIITMGFAFFTMYGIINIGLRCGFDRKLRKKLNILDFAIIGQLMAALGLGLYVWATVRHASIWTGAVAWQHFVDSWMFRQGSSPPALGLPALAKLHLFVGPIALATMLQSRVVALSMWPNVKLWTPSMLFSDVEVEGGKPVPQKAEGGPVGSAKQVVAGMAGVSVEEAQPKQDRKDEDASGSRQD